MLKSLKGFRAANFSANAENGKIWVSSVWDTAADREASDAKLTELRRTTAASAGAGDVKVEAHLPIGEAFAELDPAGPIVKLRWSRGGLTSSAEVGLVELIDRCCQQPNHLWPRTVDDWLHAVVDEIGIATRDEQPTGGASAPGDERGG